MAIEYTPQEASNLVNEAAEGGAFLTGTAAETNTAKSFASDAVTAKIAAELAEANAEASATASASSASASASSASAASGSADASASSASTAATSKTAAELAETNAETAEASASSSAALASTSETNAATSETNAATSATNASASETAAGISETNAAASYDSFDDRYLGAKAAAPTLDNDGDALIAGALYFNSVSNLMKVWSGSLWLDSFAPSGTTSWGTISGTLADQTDLQASLDTKLDLAGGTMTGTLVTPFVQFSGGTGTQGQVSWNADEETLDLVNNGATLQLGQEMHVHVRNASGVTVTDGTPLMASGTVGASGRITVVPMVGSVPANAKLFIGIATETLTNGDDGKVTSFGKVRGINTTGTPYGETWADGDVIWIDPVTTGGLTNVEPADTSLMAQSVAFVIHAATNGILQVRAQGIDEHEPLQHAVLNTGGVITGELDILHTAIASDDHAFEIDLDADGFGDVKAVNIVYTTGAISTGMDEAVVLINIDESLATGGDVAGLEVIATEGNANIFGGLYAAGVHPVEQLSGVFADMDSALVNSTSKLAEFISTGVNTEIFSADNDTVTIGSAAKFEEIEFLLATGASGSGIAPTFEFSTGVGTWTTFTPVDGTNAFKNPGVIVWLDSDIPTWAVGAGSEYLIRITRTKNSLTTPPIESKVQIAAVTEYKWDKDGDLSVNNIAVAGTVDGRDIAADGTKLDAIEALADVTDTTNVVAALTAGNGVDISAGGTVSVSAVAITTVQTAVSEIAHLALSTQEGDVVVRSDLEQTFMHNGGVAGTIADFTILTTPTDAVTSVNGLTGVVTLDNSNLTGGDVNAATGQFGTSLNVDGTATMDGLSVDGNVGIGTSSPSAPKFSSTPDGVLNLSGTKPVVYLTEEDETDSNVWMGISNSVGIIGNTGGALAFRTGASTATERMRIDSSGNVGIGTSSPSYALTVQKDVDDYIAKIENDGNTTSSNGLWVDTRWNTATNTVFKVTTNSGNSNIIVAKGDGNVGIGTDSPATKLAVSGGYISQTDGTRTLYLGSDGTGGLFGTTTDHYLRFITNNTEAMRIDSSGNLLVGKPASGQVLTKGVQLTESGGVWSCTDAASESSYFANTATSGTRYLQRFYAGSANVGSINSNGTTTSYATSSDQRLKENIADADGAGSKIDSIQVRKYDWKADGSHQDYGVIAQELQGVAPEAVIGDADSEEMMGVDYSKLVPMLIKEIQSLRNRVAQLEE